VNRPRVLIFTQRKIIAANQLFCDTQRVLKLGLGRNRYMTKIKVAVGGFAVAVMLGAMLPASGALAAKHKVDCDKVMDEINGGKSVKEVAKDLHISRSSVRRCEKKAKAEGGTMASPAAESSPAMAPAPAAPAPAAPAPAAPAPASPPSP
jgi:hypothetical protein